MNKLLNMGNFKDIEKSAKIKGIILDSCGNGERLYDWGVYIDLCGMDVTEAMKVTSGNGNCSNGNTVPIVKNRIYVSLQENGEEMELVLIPTYEMEDDVVLVLSLDEENFVINNEGSATHDEDGKFSVTIPTGTSTKFATGIKVSRKNDTPFENLLTDDVTVGNIENPKYIYVTNPSLNGFVVEYYIDNELYGTYNINFGDEITKPNVEPKEGYTFAGWTETIPGKMPNKDLKFYGKYTINSHTIYFYLNDELHKKTVYKYGETIEVPYNIVKEGYTFSGWNNVPQTMPDNDVVINSTLTINTYTLTYVINGDFASETTFEYTYGQTIENYTPENKEGYTFNGWGPVPFKMPSNDVVVNGSYSVNSYKLSFIIDGEVYEERTYNYGEIIDNIPTPTKDGYTFSGWDNEIPSTMPSNNIVISGTFTVKKYKINYYINQEYFTTQEYEYSEPIVPATVEIEEGYTFSGWEDPIPLTMPDYDITVNGTKTVNKYTITYIIDGDYFTGTLSKEYEYRQEIQNDIETTKDGYTFSGWDNEIPSTMPSNNITVTGNYIKNKYTITYVVNGHNIVREYYYGDKIESYEPTKDGHTFDGWDIEIPERMPSRNIITNGSFTPNKHNLVIYIGDELYFEKEYVFGESLNIEIPVKEGYTFNNWDKEVPSTMPDNDVILTATMTTNNYTITYYLNGEVFALDTYAFNDLIEQPSVTLDEGYTFSGWDIEIPERMPSRNLVANGTTALIDNGVKLSYGINKLSNIATYNGYEIDENYDYHIKHNDKPEGFMIIDTDVLTTVNAESGEYEMEFVVPSNPDFVEKDRQWANEEITDDEFYPEMFNNSYVFIVIIPEGTNYVIRDSVTNSDKTNLFERIFTFTKDGVKYNVYSNKNNASIPVSGENDLLYTYKIEII